MAYELNHLVNRKYTCGSYTILPINVNMITHIITVLPYVNMLHFGKHIREEPSSQYMILHCMCVFVETLV